MPAMVPCSNGRFVVAGNSASASRRSHVRKRAESRSCRTDALTGQHLAELFPFPCPIKENAPDLTSVCAQEVLQSLRLRSGTSHLGYSVRFFGLTNGTPRKDCHIEACWQICLKSFAPLLASAMQERLRSSPMPQPLLTEGAAVTLLDVAARLQSFSLGDAHRAPGTTSFATSRQRGRIVPGVSS